MSDTESELTISPLRPPLHNSSAPRDMEPTDADLEKLRKWQEERMTRKLKGEYQSAVLRLAEVVSSMMILNSCKICILFRST
jgi:outer membrane protein insertion porin family